MNINIQKFNEVAKAAKAKTDDKRWQNAIDKAVAGVESGWWVITELADCLAITTETGNTYFANGSCQCKSFEFGQACRHRALYRLYQIANEIEETATGAVSPAAVLVTNSYAGRVETPVEVVGETPQKVRVRAVTETKLGGRGRWLAPGETALVPKSAARYCGDRDLEHLDRCAPHAPVEKTSTVVDEISTGRAQVIADIKSRWSAKFPTDNLADELMRRFKRNSLEMLSVDFLQAIAAIL